MVSVSESIEDCVSKVEIQAINEMEDDDDAYIPEWIEKETEYYLNK